MYSTAAGAGGKGQIKIAKDSVCHVTSDCLIVIKELTCHIS